jgi:predicted Zn-dependent protease
MRSVQTNETPSGTPQTSLLAGSPWRPHFFSEAECHDLLHRLTRFARGGGTTGVTLRSRWAGNVRWARNQISTAGDVRMDWVTVERTIHGARANVTINDTTDTALLAAAQDAECLVGLTREARDTVLETPIPLEPMLTPQLFSEATYQLDAEQRAALAHQLAQAAAQAGLLSAGYLEVAATSIAALDTRGRVRYFQYTEAQYSVTVRDPKGTGSGWAGVDSHDWTMIDAAHLSQVALEKCLQSRNPVAVEPGRYTTILEPQAVCDFLSPLFCDDDLMDRTRNEQVWNALGPFFKTPPTQPQPGFSKLGERVADPRITISADPMDPEAGFPPFNPKSGGAEWFFTQGGAVYHPATWIDQGVLTQLAYDRVYGITSLGQPTGLPNSGAFRMSGGPTSVAEMVATTKRGLLVTRLDSVLLLDSRSLLCRGYTRDGLWLIENGKISKPVVNMVFTESILFAWNNVEQLGPPQRAFHPHAPLPPEDIHRQPQPVVVPPMKIRDFSFTALANAI